MLIGNPDKFAFLLERVPEWCSGPFVNGLLYVFMAGEQYPKEVRTTTLSDDLSFLMDSPFLHPKVDETLCALDKKELFARLCEHTFSGGGFEDGAFFLPLAELENAGYVFFIVASEREVVILAGQYISGEEIALIDAVQLDLPEFEQIQQQMQAYYNGYMASE